MNSQTIRFLAIFVCAFGFLTDAFSQTKGFSTSGSDLEKFVKSEQKSTDIFSSLKGEALPTDNVISPERYLLGPGDVLAVQIVGVISGEYPLIVSPETSVLLPRIGEISLRGKTLAEAKAEIQRIIAERNPNAQAFLSLQKARNVFVNITGNIPAPGIYSFPATMKVSTAIALTSQNAGLQNGQIARKQLPELKNVEQSSIAANFGGQMTATYAARNTIVLRKDGKTEISDVVKASILGDLSADPTVREGDQIFVPYENVLFPTISITGAVQRPAIFPFRTDDRISFLLKAAFGLKENADSSRIFLMNPTGNRQQLSAEQIFSGQSDIALEAGSSVVVEEKSTQKKAQSTITITGNVKAPGTYSIEPNTTRLREVIERAGGFTQEAYLPLAYIIRKDFYAQTAEDRELEAYRFFQYSTLSLYDTARYRLDMTIRRPTVACDFSACFDKNSEADNVPLQHGDALVIPSNPNNVMVFGQVNKPGYVDFSKGKTMQWYIERAGGSAAGAEVKRARIIKGRTKVWVEPNENTAVESGDLVYVPREIELLPGQREQLYGIITNVIASTVLLITSLLTIFRK